MYIASVCNQKAVLVFSDRYTHATGSVSSIFSTLVFTYGSADEFGLEEVHLSIHGRHYAQSSDLITVTPASAKVFCQALFIDPTNR